VNLSNFLYLPTVTAHGLFQRCSGWTWRREQSFNELPRSRGIQLNLLALSNQMLGDFTRMSDHEFGQGATFNGSGFTEKFFVRHGYPGDESLLFRFFQCRSHAPNVCLQGTQFKN
jgi:hypothetical protein